MDIQKAVIPAKAGIQLPRDRLENWMTSLRLLWSASGFRRNDEPLGMHPVCSAIARRRRRREYLLQDEIGILSTRAALQLCRRRNRLQP
jgi:hypothetical protein